MLSRGEGFINSLNDGRSVLFEGERIKNLGSHPAFKGTLETISRLFNLLDDPNERDKVGFKLPDKESYAHSSFLVPYTLEDLQNRSLGIHNWSKETHGMMTRLSDYARSMITGWYAARKELGKLDQHFETKITAYYTAARDNDLFLTTAIVDPQIDRSSGLEDNRVAERFLHVVKETSDGIIVRGAKMIATGAPYTHDFIISSFLEFKPEEAKHAHVLIVPANSQGLHIVCRESFADRRKNDHILEARDTRLRAGSIPTVHDPL